MRNIFISGSTVEDLNVSNLSNNASLPDRRADEMEPGTSPRVMLTTMILLIVGLFLTGTMMLHYANHQNAPLAEGALNDPQNMGGLNLQAAAMSLLKKTGPEVQNPAESEVSTAASAEKKANMIDQLLKKRPDDIKWPKMKLTGFGTASDGSDGFAIINNDHYQVGQSINGKVRLLEVRKHDVLVELNGTTKTLSVNMTD